MSPLIIEIFFSLGILPAILACDFMQVKFCGKHIQSDPCDMVTFSNHIYMCVCILLSCTFCQKRKNMGKALWSFLVFTCLLIPLAVADWNILKLQTQDGLKISLKNYCESWRMNVELHNIRDFQVVPEECTEYIGKYVKSTQYKVDSQRASEECLVYLSTSCNLKKDGLDAWIFDIDDTLLSTVPYYKNNLYG